MGYGILAGQQGTAKGWLGSASTQTILRQEKQTQCPIVVGEKPRLIVCRPSLAPDGFARGPKILLAFAFQGRHIALKTR